MNKLKENLNKILNRKSFIYFFNSRFRFFFQFSDSLNFNFELESNTLYKNKNKRALNFSRTHQQSAMFTPLFFCLFLFCISPLPVVISRRHNKLATVTFDVSSSLTKTIQILTTDPDVASKQALLTGQHQEDKLGNFSLNLHSRDYFFRRENIKDYRSLTLSRLRRDAARVRYISIRQNLALDKTMRAPVLSGSTQGSGEYFSRISIGQPAKSMYMVLDTGSDVTWIQCQPCYDCYQQADPIYDPTFSSTFSPIPCNSTQCMALRHPGCLNSGCLYQVSYGDGSYTVGELGTETVRFGDGRSVSNVAFGCGHDNEGLFVGAAGILGLGGGHLSFPSQISATDFSYCLVDRDSTATSTLEFASKTTTDLISSSTDSITAPLLRSKKSDTFYYVNVVGMSVGGHILSIPSSTFAIDEDGNGGVIIDSGTAVTRLHPDAYSQLRQAFSEGTTALPSTVGVALFDTCYDLSSRTSVDVPTIGFVFPEGKVLNLPAKNYIVPVDSLGTFCLAFAPTDQESGLSIIGNVQQQGTRVSFDLAKSRIEFTSDKC